jgi:hypothetical protein
MYCTNILHEYELRIPFARSPKFILSSSECNVACLSAEHIPDLVSYQDHR